MLATKFQDLSLLPSTHMAREEQAFKVLPRSVTPKCNNNKEMFKQKQKKKKQKKKSQP